MSDSLDFLLANRTKTLTFIGVTQRHLVVELDPIRERLSISDLIEDIEKEPTIKGPTQPI